MDLREIPAVDYSEYEEHHEVTMEEDEGELPPLRSLLAPSRVPPLPMVLTTTMGTTSTITTASAAAGAAAVARANSSIVGALQQVCIIMIRRHVSIYIRGLWLWVIEVYSFIYDCIYCSCRVEPKTQMMTRELFMWD